jgi:hypothetical protein
LSGAITNLWTPPTSAPRPVDEESSSLIVSPHDLIEEDDEEGAVTGLKDPVAFQPPSLPPPMAVPPQARNGVPAPSVLPRPVLGAAMQGPQSAPPVSKGGTLAMQVTPPASFPPTPPGLDVDDGDVPRTKILNAVEALRAATTADPRPPHALSRQRDAQSLAPPPNPPAFPSPSLAPQQYMPSNPVLARGVMLGGGAVEEPLFSPPPAAVPTFGAPPVRPATVRPLRPEDVPDPMVLAPLGFENQARPTPPPPPAEIAVPAAPARPFSGPMGFEPSAGLSEPTARPYKLYAALGIAVLAVLGLVAYASYLLLSGPNEKESGSAESSLPTPIVEALRQASPASLSVADVELAKIEGNATKAVVDARLQHRVLTAFEVRGSDNGLRAAIDGARAHGLSAEEVAYAEIAEAVLSGDLVQAAERADQSSGCAKDTLCLWTKGIMLERQGKSEALEAFASAVALTPAFGPARLRLIRISLLAGDTAPFELAKKESRFDPGSLAALEALAWAQRKVHRDEKGEGPLLNMTSADVSRCLHPVFGAVAVLQKPGEGRGGPTDPALKQAVLEAESPQLAVFFGEVAALRGDEAATALGAARALALAPTYSPALRLLTQDALRTGRFEELAVSAKGMSPTAATELHTLIAYETGDLSALSTLAQSTDGSFATTLRRALAGPQLVTSEELDKIKERDPRFAELVLVDRLLLVGSLKEARAVVAKWPDASEHAARAQRAGRLLRAEGANRESEKALGAATAGWVTQLERILLGVATKENRAHALSLSDVRAGPSASFAAVLVQAKMGEVERATEKVAQLPLPAADAPWLVSVVAALALAETNDPRAEALLATLRQQIPGNVDLARATELIAARKAEEEASEEKSAKPTPQPKPSAKKKPRAGR